MKRITNFATQKWNSLTAIKYCHHSKNNVPIWLFKCDCGKEKEILIYNVINGTTKSCGCLYHKKRLNLINKKFNKLTVIEYFNSNNDGRCIWLCKCDCGNEIKVLGKNLIDGHTGTCKNCFKVIPFFIFSEIETSAKRRNIEFNITIEYIANLLVKQNYKCKLSDLDLIMPQKTKDKNLKTASLDRIDSSKGYIEDNVQWVHKKVNYMKMDLPQEEFILLCKKVTNTQQ